MCTTFENHLVRIPVVTAAMVSMEVGPPTMTGLPTGTAMQTEVGRLTGKLQLDTIEPKRAAEEPPKLTVLLPVTSVPLLAGMSLGAKETPGGMGKCLMTALTSVPVLAAGRPLTRTAPPPMTAPTAAPTGSKTMPTKGCGMGVGTGPAGVGTMTMCRSTPITMSKNLAA